MSPHDRGLSRREWILGVGAAGLWGLEPGCAPGPMALSGPERRLLHGSSRPLPIVKWPRHRPDPRSPLRGRALAARPLGRATLGRIDELMRETLARSGGVGLAGPQVGLRRRVILVQCQDRERRVIFCVDPRLRPIGQETEDGYEACLSVDGVGGLVRRCLGVEVTYADLGGESVRRVSSGFEARIFQHEVDHLDGVLYLDRLRSPLLPIDEVRRRRERPRAEAVPRGPWLMAGPVALPRNLGGDGARSGVEPEGLLL